MKQCNIEGCSNYRQYKFYCSTHYKRQRKFGSPLENGRQRRILKGFSNRSVPGWNSWKAMQDRCLNPRLSEYKYYGGRGITICPRWLGQEGFYNFLQDMGPRPTPKHTIDRVNPEGNYTPSNCEWATKRQQTVNKRNYYKKVCFEKYADGWTLQVWVRGYLIHIRDYDTTHQLLGALCTADLRWLTPTTNTKYTQEIIVPY